MTFPILTRLSFRSNMKAIYVAIELDPANGSQRDWIRFVSEDEQEVLDYEVNHMLGTKRLIRKIWLGRDYNDGNE